MNPQDSQAIPMSGQSLSTGAINKTLRNTYIALAMMIGVAMLSTVAAMAGGLYFNLPWFVDLVVFYGLMFAIFKFSRSAAGLGFAFLFCAYMGLRLAPFMAVLPGDLIASAAGLTAITFLGLSGYCLTTKKDFSFLGGFLVAGCFIIMGAVILNIFMQIPALHLAIMSAFVIFSCVGILYTTSAMVNGGETNYIVVAVSLFVHIYNLFMSLLSLLSAFSGD